MRHRKRTIKLGRTGAHRDAMLANMVCNLINESRVKTTLPKARAARSLAEKMVTLGKKGTLAARRRALSTLRRNEPVRTLFESIAPAFTDRQGGYTRIIKIGQRMSDSSEMAYLEWVNYTPKPPKKKKPKKGEEAAPAAAPAKSEKAEKAEKAESKEKKPRKKKAAEKAE